MGGAQGVWQIHPAVYLFYPSSAWMQGTSICSTQISWRVEFFRGYDHSSRAEISVILLQNRSIYYSIITNINAKMHNPKLPLFSTTARSSITFKKKTKQQINQTRTLLRTISVIITLQTWSSQAQVMWLYCAVPCHGADVRLTLHDSWWIMGKTVLEKEMLPTQSAVLSYSPFRFLLQVKTHLFTYGIAALLWAHN